MILLDRCCMCLSLRTGVILLGIVELTGSVFSLFLLVFSLSFLNDLNDMLLTDMENNPHSYPPPPPPQQPPNSDAVNSTTIRSSYEETNHNWEMNMHAAKRIKTDEHVLYTCVFFVTVQAVGCAMLLYGAIKRHSQFLKPWLAMVSVGLVCNVIAFMIYMFIYGFYLPIFLTGASELVLMLYLWLCVFSYYHQLTEDEQHRMLCHLSISNTGEWKGNYQHGISCPYRV